MVIDFVYVGVIIRTVVALCIGFPLLWMACRALHRVLGYHMSPHVSALAANIVLYTGWTFLGISILHDLGFNLSALLGAAGIIGIALGFAAQTSVANIISGLFLVLEGSCGIGDEIEHDAFVGTIESIDLLSVKIRTLDNTFVRIPNEFFVKKVMVNKTYYTHRTIAFKVGVSVDYDMEKAMHIIRSVAESSELFLTSPAPKIHLYEVNSAYVGGYEKGLYLVNEIKVEISVQKATVRKARDLFVTKLQRALAKEQIKAMIVRL